MNSTDDNTLTHRVGLIGGFGWMGRAFGRAMLQQKVVNPAKLCVSSRWPQPSVYAKWPDVRITTDNQRLVDESDLVILAIRPNDFNELTIDVRGKTVVSLLAMASVDVLANRLDSRRILRAMPNAAVEIGRAYIPWFACDTVPEVDVKAVQRLLSSCGVARQMPSEAALDYMTALSGSGPALPGLLARAMLMHARSAGLDNHLALEAVLTTLAGGSQLLAHWAQDPTDMINCLLDYRGTTAKGLKTLIDGGFEALVAEGLSASHQAATVAFEDELAVD